MKRHVKKLILLLAMALIAVPAAKVRAATPEEIEASIQAGVDWLVSQQDPDTGQWQDVPRTGFVLVKLQDRAYELERDPFETNPEAEDYYEYATNVIKGWEYLFAVDGSGNPIHARKENISSQDHTGGASGTIDDPDTRVNGYGIYFSGRSIYNTGICLMAIASSRTPNRVNDGGIDYDGDGNADTFGEIAQDVVDWLAYAQTDDGGAFEGGYAYGPSNNSGNFADNSNSGYAYLGLAAAEGFTCTVPAWVRTELNAWIGSVQDPVDGDADDGGSWYYPTDPRGSWANELKAGNLIFEMTFYGDDTSAQRFQDAMDYIERHWQGLNVAPGWHGDIGIDDDSDGLVDEDPFNYIDDDGDLLTDEDRGRNAHYQAMYCLMKGLEYSLIDLIDLDGDNTPEHDWFDEFATVLLAQQQVSGSWPSSPCYVWPAGDYGAMSGEILSTVWALLTLEKITPPPPEIPVFVDIKPQSCPNPINLKSKGVLPVAVLGTAEFDVSDINPWSLRLSREGVEDGDGDPILVAPLRWASEDVATPFEGELCDCHELGADGYVDRTLKFDTAEVVEKLKLDEVAGETVKLTLTGYLWGENLIDPGPPIRGEDCVWVLSTGPKDKNGK